MTWENVRQIAGVLPGAEAGTSYSTPAFFVKKKLFVRFHQSGESVVVRIPIPAREAMMKTDPESFYITDHYLHYPAMLVRLASVEPEDLRNLIVESWRQMAPAKLIAQYDGRLSSTKSHEGARSAKTATKTKKASPQKPQKYKKAQRKDE